MPLFLMGLGLFAIYWSELVAAGLGVIWIIGRLVYSASYMADLGKRSTGFLIQFLAGAVLLFGALGKIVYSVAIESLTPFTLCAQFTALSLQFVCQTVAICQREREHPPSDSPKIRPYLGMTAYPTRRS